MLTILLHSSKTTRRTDERMGPGQSPLLLSKANDLASYVGQLSIEQIQASMRLSHGMAVKTHEMWQDWPQSGRLPAIDLFLGDIYSGLQVHRLSEDDRKYANEHLYILSGLYGVLRALDYIAPYRLEMGYKLPAPPFNNLYKFWGDDIAKVLPSEGAIVSLSAVEYTKVVLPYLGGRLIISPKFMTVDGKTKQPKFVTVHAKIARGAFAHWLIVNKIDDIQKLVDFDDLGYQYSSELSTDIEPVFVCESFKGLGLSVRLLGSK
ncbi:MAG TPA: YaaA family protein [Candidatus Saccharibacteria bacterium]|nr:YaaA family protein [Candidatus Saccharibacteria bacterium]HRQ97762.1 YaaA family protein [Candidatus Saccharibacteria bacterium]